MARDRFNPRGSAAHEIDAETSLCVEQFLDSLKQDYSTFTWYGNRTTDILILECDHRGLHLKMSYFVPRKHPDYLASIGVQSLCSGNRDEEINLDVTDVSRRWGRKYVIREWFRKDCALFPKALDTFNSIRTTVTPLMPSKIENRVGYAETIQSARYLLFSSEK